MKKPFDLSDGYWERLTQRDRELYGIVRPLPKAAYTVDHQLSYIEKFIVQQTEDMASMGGSFELDPDYQRGHVWTHLQRVGYIEALLRDSAPKTILFNCPGWTRSDGAEGDIPNNTFHRIAAVLEPHCLADDSMQQAEKIVVDLCLAQAAGEDIQPKDAP